MNKIVSKYKDFIEFYFSIRKGSYMLCSTPSEYSAIMKSS